MNPGLIIDIVLLVLSVLIIIKFALKGFFSSVLDVCKLGISLIISFVVRMPIAKLLSKLFMKKAMYGVVENSLNAYLESDFSKVGIIIDIESLFLEKASFLEKFLPKFGLDYESFKNEFAGLSQKTGDELAGSIDSISSNLGGAIALLISVVISLIVVFVISYVALIILAKVLENLTKFDGVKQVNRWLGVALGVVVSLLIMWGVSMGLLALVEFVGPVAPNVINPDLTEKSMIVGIFKNINLIDFIKSKIYK